METREYLIIVNDLAVVFGPDGQNPYLLTLSEAQKQLEEMRINYPEQEYRLVKCVFQ